MINPEQLAIAFARTGVSDWRPGINCTGIKFSPELKFGAMGRAWTCDACGYLTFAPERSHDIEQPEPTMAMLAKMRFALTDEGFGWGLSHVPFRKAESFMIWRGAKVLASAHGETEAEAIVKAIAALSPREEPIGTANQK